jgi:hypothetical protein
MRGPPPNASEIYEFYIDESSQTNHRFLVLGGIIIPQLNLAAMRQAIWGQGELICRLGVR